MWHFPLILGNHMNLHLEEYQGAVRKKNEPENPLKDLHQRMEEEKQDLIRHLKGRQLSSALLLFRYVHIWSWFGYFSAQEGKSGSIYLVKS